MIKPKKRCYRKKVDLYLLLNKLKLWPSRSGVLHGIKKIVKKGNYAEITTHCGHTFIISLSKNSRAARWLRNKWYLQACHHCRIPLWKLEKYAMTEFTQHHGSTLNRGRSDIEATR